MDDSTTGVTRTSGRTFQKRHRNFNPRFSSGLSKWGWLLVVVFGVFIATTAIRLVPHYLDYQIVLSVAERLPKKEVHANMSKNEIMEHFRRQFRVENFQIPVQDVMVINRDQYETVLDVNYEVREHLFYNIDVVLVFSDKRVFE